MEQTVSNPLLAATDPLRYDAVAPEHVAPAVATLLAECRAALARVTAADVAAGWDSVVEPLTDATERLGRAWGAVAHLNAVVDTPQLRAAHNAALPLITAFWTELSQNLALYDKFQQIAARADFAAWPASRRRVIANDLRDFRLGGAQLPGPAKEQFRRLRERQAELGTRFAENVLDASNDFALFIDADDAPLRLAGIPADVQAIYRAAALAAGRPGFKITLQFPSYGPALQYADDRTLREQLYRAYATRASDLGRPEWDNSAVMVELLQLRDTQAKLLGYPDYVALSLVPKMAASREQVLQFLRDLAARARPHAERDMAELRDFARATLQLPDLQSWDIAYASEKLRQARYAYSEQEVKQYFPAERVLQGLFRTIETLFGVAIHADSAPTWHPDVQFFRVTRVTGAGGDALVGHFYLDLYARDHKQGGAWQDDARGRRRSGAGLATPVSLMTCNFSPPVDGRAALLTHDEVLTLFHEFGHGLHHLLTQVDESQVAGIRGVEWDAVELPSQFMENFAWDWEVLQSLSAHADTGQPLPRELYERMRAAKNFQSGMQMVRQLEFALFDILAHSRPDPQRLTSAELLELADAVRREVAVVFPPPYQRAPHSFSHVFAGGYAAGYYSYKWAEVLSADCYAVFESQPSVLDAPTGKRFRAAILEVGGSRPALESFVAFLGRPPAIDALLRHSGMASA